MNKIGQLINEMITYYTGDARRINHFMKVYAYAKAIGELEGIEKGLQEILEVAAVVHDIGIKISEEKYQSSAGHYQELEGPKVAYDMLEKLGYERALIERVCYLIAHHHTYHDINGLDYQILVEADFLVNIYEDQMTINAIQSVEKKIFRTKTGLIFLRNCFRMEV